MLLKVALLVLLAAGLVFAFMIPVTLKVGGESEVVPDFEHFAYVEMDGIVEKVFIKEGDSVEKGALLALPDSTELDYEIRKTQRMIDSYRTEIGVLRNMGAEDPTKLAESNLVAIKAQRAQQELEFLTWQRRFLEVKAPVAGIVLAQKVDTLIGKRFKAGEPFCSIAPHKLLGLDVFIREGDTAYVKPAQKAVVYFNYQPEVGHGLTVERVSPKAETLESLGAVFRVRAAFKRQPPGIKPGMKGITQINTQETELWFAVTRRLRTKLNELMLLF